MSEQGEAGPPGTSDGAPPPHTQPSGGIEPPPEAGERRAGRGERDQPSETGEHVERTAAAPAGHGAQPRESSESSTRPATADQPERTREQPAAAPSVPDEQVTDPPRRVGRIRYQDATTVPREPTLAERRARQLGAREAEQREQARWDEAARQAKRRRRMLIGGSAVVGVAAVIAIGYTFSRPDNVEARCTDDHNVVVNDSNCVTPAANSTGYYHGAGLYPIFIGSGGRQYHYTYGGTGDLGQVASGGSTVPPKTGTATTASGRVVVGGSGANSGSSSISRGGFGVGGSSGGKSAGG